MKLRVKGEMQEANVGHLMDSFDQMNERRDHQVGVHFDRGYCKISFVISIVSKGFNACTIATKLGSKHPFILHDEDCHTTLLEQ